MRKPTTTLRVAKLKKLVILASESEEIMPLDIKTIK